MSTTIGLGLAPANRETIGDRIRRARRAAGMSQARLGALIGTPRTNGVNVSNWETGTKKPDLSTIYRVARALGCDVRELLGLA